jgi:transposase InsO family protein
MGYPMDRIATDILGEFPLTDTGNRYILVVSDCFSKWTEAFPMPNMEAQTVAKLIVEEVICRFGVPASIHFDQGRQYENLLFSDVCKHLQIRKTRTTTYHPQSDGMVERFNKTLVTMMSSYVDENYRDWDESITFVMMAYRSLSIHPKHAHAW